jgi:hypothetical protein
MRDRGPRSIFPVEGILLVEGILSLLEELNPIKTKPLPRSDDSS